MIGNAARAHQCRKAAEERWVGDALPVRRVNKHSPYCGASTRGGNHIRIRCSIRRYCSLCIDVVNCNETLIRISSKVMALVRRQMKYILFHEFANDNSKMNASGKPHQRLHSQAVPIAQQSSRELSCPWFLPT